jgi:hypothetical protein
VYDIPAPGAGTVTVIVPAGTVQDGWAVTVAVGAAGGLFTVIVAVLLQPLLFV